MKKFLKVSAIFMAFVMAAVSYQMFVFASVKTNNADVALLQEGDFDIYDDKLRYDTSSQYGLFSSQTAEEFIYEQLLNCSEKFKVYSYRITTSEFIDLYANIINDNPDLFYVSSTVSYSYVESTTNYIYEISPRYSMTSDEIANAKIIFNKGVDKALSTVDDSMNDVQKALVIHDYICDIATYPVLNSAADDKDIYHSAYGLFYDGNVVCAGYALAYSYLMNELGIECEYVTSDPMKHAWNAIKINGKWYNVDITWDDMSLYNNSMNIRGGMFHSCFLKSNSSFSGGNGYYHYGGTTYGNLEMDDTTYDNYFWDDVCTNINVVNGDYYYFDYDGSSFRGYLTKRDLNGNETTIGSSISCINNKITGVSYDEDGNAYTHSMIDPFVRIVYLDNRFYITTVRQIISVDLNGNRQNITSDSNYCFGLGISDNELVYQNYSQYMTVLLDKEDYFSRYMSTPTSSGYNNYPDINNDGVINAKDYSMIIKQ